MRFVPAALATAAAAVVEGVFRVRGKHPPVCREMVRTMLHGHRYDGSLAAQALGLTYTPVRETLDGRSNGHGPKASCASKKEAPMTHHQHKDDFAEGQESPEHSAEEPEPNFARGQSGEPLPGTEHHGHFDEGQDDFPEDPEREVERRFSEGQELSPDSRVGAQH